MGEVINEQKGDHAGDIYWVKSRDLYKVVTFGRKIRRVF